MHVVEEFFRVYQVTVMDINSSLQPLEDLTGGKAREPIISTINQLRKLGQYQAGNFTYTINRIESSENQDGQPSVVIIACTDSRGTTTMDVKTKKPVIPDPKVPYMSWKFDVQNVQGWRIVDGGNRREESCG